MTSRSDFRRSVWLCSLGWGAPLAFVLAAGLICVRDARGDSAVEPAAESARPRSDAAGSDHVARPASARPAPKVESAAPEAPARPGALPSAPSSDGRTQAKATAPESDDRRVSRGSAANPCVRDAPAPPRAPKGRGKASKRLNDDVPCLAAGNGRAAAPAEPTRNVRAPIENSEAAHTPVSAAIENLAFENGEIPHARAALERIKKDFAKCALLEPGPADGTVEFRFIVRAPGKAEGVDVGRVKGVSADIVRCATSALTLRSVGAPSAEPVGVILTVRFGNS